MSKSIAQNILSHQDSEEIISKIILGINPIDIHDWLAAKYTSVGDKKFVISVKGIKDFQKNYLDMYKMIKNDLSKTKAAIAMGTSDELQLALKDNPAYKSKMMELAGKEIDIKRMLSSMLVGIETRAAQLFDAIQEDPRNINTREDRNLREWFDTLGNNLERFHKIVNGTPDQVIQHNVTVQHIDQHVQVLQEAVRETLSEMDLESSLRFMEIFNEKFSKLKAPSEKIESTETRMVEAKLLNQTINKKINSI